MAREDYPDLVRFRNDGEDFHINWTVRRALRILGSDDLCAVSIEGISEKERLKGKVISAGLLVADTVEYYGGEDLQSATLIVYSQLKYSTQTPDEPWPWGDLSPVITGFAQRYTAYAAATDRKLSRAKLRFRFVTNRPVSANVLGAVDYLSGATADAPAGHMKKAVEAIREATGLEGPDLAAFLKLVELGKREASREALAAQAAKAANDMLPNIVREPVTVLRDMVRRLGTTSHTVDPTIRRETVLQAFGIDDPASLFPAPPEFETVVNEVAREQETPLAHLVCTAQKPILITASGGTGKSIIAQRIADLAPPGSETVVFDGFAGGRYRDPSERRHLHRVGLVQIANELAGRGLCDVLLPTPGSDREFLVAFRTRLQQAAALVQKRGQNTLIVVVLDAADNSVFAAGEYREATFVSDLLAEAPPQGCRIIGLARPERLNGLHPDKVEVFPLSGFNLAETRRFIAAFGETADDEACETFRRLTFGNPRVQANQLMLAGSLEHAIRQLGPGGLSIEDLIEEQLEQALSQVRLAQPEADVDTLCTGIAILPPMVPINVLASVAAASAPQIASFASDFGGGRPLMLRENALQFRDEPVEKWFHDRFVADEAAAGQFADRLMPIAQRDAYCALALPQLLLRANRHPALMALALTSDPGFTESPVERQAIVLQQVRFALRSALELEDMASVAKLLVRAGEQIATNERQDRFLAENADLVPLLSGSKVTEDFVHRRQGGSWFGAVNAYKAEMLAVLPETSNEARGFLYLADRWLEEWVRQQRLRDPDDWTLPEERIGEDDIAAMLLARCRLDGAEAAARFAEGFRPGEFRFKFALICATKLLDAGHDTIARTMLDHLICGETRLAFHFAFSLRGMATSGPSVERTLVAVEVMDIPDRPLGFDDENLANAIVTLVEEAVSHGLETAALALLARANWSLSSHPLPDGNGRAERAMRTTALRKVLSGKILTVDALWAEANSRNTRELPPVRADFRDIHARLLPVFEVRAKVIARRPVDLTENAEDLAQMRSAVSFERWQERRLRGIWMMAQIDLLLRAGHLDVDRLHRLEARAVKDGTLWKDECLTLIGLFTPHEAFHDELLRWADIAARLNQDADDDAEARTGGLIRIARNLLPVVRDESAEYFRQALEDADRVGEELHERLEVLLEMGRSVADQSEAKQSVYRILKLAEAYCRINNHKFPWEAVFGSLAKMDAASALAGACRLDSRDRVPLSISLPEIGEVLLSQGSLGFEVAAALHAFGGIWDYPDLPAAISALGVNVREPVVQTLLRDMVDDNREAWYMRRLVTAASAVTAIPADVGAVFEKRRVQEERSSGSFVPAPVEPIDYTALVAARDMFDPADVATVVEEFKRAGAFRAPLADQARAMREGIDVSRRVEHLKAIAAADVEMEDLLELLSCAKEAWSTSRAVKACVRTLAAELIERRAFDFRTYRWQTCVGPLRELTGESEENLLRTFVKALGARVDHLGSSSMFWLARQVHIALVPPDRRPEVLAFTLARFETILSGSEPDGAWAQELHAVSDAHHAIAGIIWTILGDPGIRKRWRAVHVVHRLARFGQSALIETLLGYLSNPDGPAFIDPRLVFYAEHARTFLLIAAARIARETPELIVPAIPMLRDLASPHHRHVLQRHWAMQALCALNEKDAPLLAEAGCAPLCSPFAVSETSGSGSKPDPTGADLQGYYLPHDFERRTVNPIARAFGISPEEMRDRIVHSIRTMLGWEPTSGIANDPRYDLGLLDRRWHTGPARDGLALYEASHGLYYAIGDLLERCEDLPDFCGEEAYLLADQFLSRPPHWLSDVRDPDPTVLWPALSVSAADSADRWSATTEDFEAALFDGDTGLRIGGSWVRHTGFAREEAGIACGLVRPQFARDLLCALETYPGQYPPSLPFEGDSLDVGLGKMRVTPLIARTDPPHGLDYLDPFAGNITAARRPGKLIRRGLRLAMSDHGRNWKSRDDRLLLEIRSTAWGAMPQDLHEEDLDHGDILSCPLDQVVRTLSAVRRSLVAQVRFDRRSSRRQGQENEIYARYFILDGDGQLHWCGGSRRAWPPSGRTTG